MELLDSVKGNIIKIQTTARVCIIKLSSVYNSTYNTVHIIWAVYPVMLLLLCWWEDSLGCSEVEASSGTRSVSTVCAVRSTTAWLMSPWLSYSQHELMTDSGMVFIFVKYKLQHINLLLVDWCLNLTAED